MSILPTLRQKLEADFSPTHLEILDESAPHKGHAGYAEGGESHLRIIIVSDAFAGVSKVERQRKVYTTLKDELRSGKVHAVTGLEVFDLEEWKNR